MAARKKTVAKKRVPKTPTPKAARAPRRQKVTDEERVAELGDLGEVGEVGDLGTNHPPGVPRTTPAG